MFKYFRKKPSLSKIEREFLQTVFSILRPIYSHLVLEIDHDTIVGLQVADSKYYGKGSYNIQFAHNTYESLINENLSHSSSIRNIKIDDKKGETYYLHLFFAYGVPISLKFSGKFANLNLATFDISQHILEEFKTETIPIIEKLKNEIVSKYLDLTNSYSVELSEGTFFTIKNLEDGNYLAVNRSGKIFGLWHDPYIVEEIFNSVEDFQASIQNGTFDINDYVSKFHERK